MINYIFDGSFEGLLTAIYEAYYRREQPENILPCYNVQQSLIFEHVHITTDYEKAEKVYHAIRHKISPTTLSHAYYVFLSELEGCGTWIYRYLQFGFQIGKDVNRYLSDERVFQVHNISQKVGREKHLLLGLVRFKQLDSNLYYASLEPDYNIIALLAPHFSKRLAHQNWIIHDLKRKIAVIYNQKQWVIIHMPNDSPIVTNETEATFQQLWKQYFKSISIDSRKNLRLQKQYIPARYWRHLVEKQ